MYFEVRATMSNIEQKKNKRDTNCLRIYSKTKAGCNLHHTRLPGGLNRRIIATTSFPSRNATRHNRVARLFAAITTSVCRVAREVSDRARFAKRLRLGSAIDRWSDLSFHRVKKPSCRLLRLCVQSCRIARVIYTFNY